MKYLKRTNGNGGFILPLTCFLLFAVSIALAGSIGYISFSTRVISDHVAATQCRLAAQSGLESVKVQINQKFRRYAGLDSRNYIATFPAIFNTWFGSWTTNSIGSGANTTVKIVPMKINDCDVNVSIFTTYHSAGVAAADVVMRSTASMETTHGSILEKTIEETVRFGIGTSEVFNYAYFINNHGWFQGGGGRAYGDIRANGDMDLDGSCYVNGAVYAAANSELGVDGNISNTGRFYTPNAYKNYAPDRARPLGDGMDGGYTNPDTNGDGKRDDLHQNLSEDDQIFMPYLGDLDVYKEQAVEENGTIKQGGKTIVAAYFNGAGPSGLTTDDAADKGCIVLIGTAANPIEINGSVVVQNDVLISGYVKGQGTIYSGRNIHILNNIKYVNPPTWSNKSNPAEAVAESNNAKDMLGLSAKGNIVIGNYTASDWMSGVKQYITNPWVHAYKCDASDSDIGYASTFNGNYTAKDGGNQIITQEVGAGTYHTEYQPYYDRWGRYAGTKAVQVEDTKIVYTSSQERKYYESSVCDSVITANAQNNITQIDAILYNNHAIMGKVGACSFNGALVCRDEALNYSGSITFNWDIRLFTAAADSSNGLDPHLPKSVSAPYVLAWREVQ